MKRALGAMVLGLGLTFGAAAPAKADEIYGEKFLTNAEKHEYEARVRLARNEVERQRIINEHNQRVQARAKAQGVTLPAPPPRESTGPKKPQGGHAGGHY
jgi:hypothetical protein